MIKKIICLIISFMLFTCLMADTITLVNGETLNGKVTGYDKNNVYYETNGGDWVIIKKDTIVSNVRTSGLEIREGKSRYPNNFTIYRVYKVTKEQINVGYGIPTLSNYPKSNPMDAADSTDIKLAYLYEMQKMNTNMQLIYIPLWITCAISIGMVITLASYKK